MTRPIYNFSAGPGVIPRPALELAQQELLDFDGTGRSVMEHSHRGPAFTAVNEEVVSGLREVLAVPDTHELLLIQGGASFQFGMIPMSFLGPGQSADYAVTGNWAKRAYEDATVVGTARSIAKVEDEDGHFRRVPTNAEIEAELDPNAAYLHITTNNTIYGTQYHQLPDTKGVPLVADLSSDILWKPMDYSRFALAYASTQKNIGPSGIAVVIIAKDFMAKANTALPRIYRYDVHAAQNSVAHTPSTFSVYMVRNVLRWVKAQGGAAAMEKHNRAKAQLLYDAIDAKADFYRSGVDRASRSVMNVVFHLPSKELDAKFVAEAEAAGLATLKGHRKYGGIRASIYNAMPREGVEALVAFMEQFAKNNG